MADQIWETVKIKEPIGIWAEHTIQNELEGTKRNKAVCKIFAKRMQERGYNCTWSQLCMKIKNLVAKYQKIRDDNKQINWQFIYYGALHTTI